jgi:PPM family protein phosphatase
MNIIRQLFGGKSEKKSQPPSPTATPKPLVTGPVVPEIKITAPDEKFEALPQAPMVTPPAVEDDITPVAPMAVSNAPVGPLKSPVTSDPTARLADPVGQVTRHLNTKPLETAKHLTFGLTSDVGTTRSNNEDAVFAMFGSQTSFTDIPDFGIFVVADGMGGHNNGERASSLATQVISTYLLEHFYLSLLNPKPDEKPFVTEVLTEAVQKANETISEQLPDGGTTLTAAVLLNDMVFVAHVGDSRAYVFNREGRDLVTRDHSLVQRLIELEQLTPEEAAIHPQRNVLYRAIGQSDILEIDTSTRRVPAGGQLVLCTDGLWGQVSEELIYTTVREAAHPQEACDKLVAMANERGGIDNVTVVVVQMPS